MKPFFCVLLVSGPAPVSNLLPEELLQRSLASIFVVDGFPSASSGRRLLRSTIDHAAGHSSHGLLPSSSQVCWSAAYSPFPASPAQSLHLQESPESRAAAPAHSYAGTTYDAAS